MLKKFLVEKSLNTLKAKSLSVHSNVKVAAQLTQKRSYVNLNKQQNAIANSQQSRFLQNNLISRSSMMTQNKRVFSTEQKQQEVVIEEPEPILHDTVKREFKAETKKLLDIVAKSIYTDKEVFIRELLSNCSDALEKQRFSQVSGTSSSSNDLYINITTNTKDRIFTLFDSGIGMSRDEIVDNLGTIAKSGSQAFLQELKDKNQEISESIIGQFGVGFYSSFIVADLVEVITKAEGQTGVRWVSDGSGDYEVSDAENLGFERGTKIILKLKPECREFCTENEVEKVIKKFSQFISYPIKLNGQVINTLQAIWYRDKKEISQDEYERFFEQTAGTKIPYKYCLHYSTDVPLSIKALLYVPSQTSEKFGVGQETGELHLYSRKILIKPKCRELLQPYLRFVKGVVDCEDLPLNISRENYQDSSLMSKLKNVLTRRILKFLEDESRRDPDKYNQWYGDFNNFIKEGISTDQENAEQLLKLLRFNTSYSLKQVVSLDDFMSKLKPTSDKIYFMVAPNAYQIHDSPFMEPFKGTDVPVLFLNNSIDEYIFNQQGNFKGKRFTNIENNYEEIAKDLGHADKNLDEYSRIPEEDITTFSLWLKNELQPTVGKVTLSKRLKNAPAILVGQVSSSMRMMMSMMDKGTNMDEQSKNQTLEINPAHPIIVNLNYLRKVNPKQATLVTKQMLDNVMLQSGVPFDTIQASKRSYELIENVLDAYLEAEGGAQRKLKSSDESKQDDTDNKESILSKTQRERKGETGKKIVKDMHVDESHFKK